jgi:excisionase family DNA binding protein
MLTVREVACLLAVSTATVYKLCAPGELDHARVLNALRISLADVGRFVGSGSRRRGE